MWIIIAVIVVFIAINVIKGVLSAINQPDLDANGNMRCKGCGGSNFAYWKNTDGTTTYECHSCGKRWTRY